MGGAGGVVGQAGLGRGQEICQESFTIQPGTYGGEHGVYVLGILLYGGNVLVYLIEENGLLKPEHILVSSSLDYHAAPSVVKLSTLHQQTPVAEHILHVMTSAGLLSLLAG